MRFDKIATIEKHIVAGRIGNADPLWLTDARKVFFGVFDKEGRETRITSCPAKGSSDREKHLCWFYPRLARA